MAYKMKGPSLYNSGFGVKGAIKNQKTGYEGQADGRATSSPFQQTEKQKANLPEERVAAIAKKKSPLEQRVTKGGEGADENKIFDKSGKHVGDYVNGKKVMHTKAQHAKIEKKK